MDNLRVLLFPWELSLATLKVLRRILIGANTLFSRQQNAGKLHIITPAKFRGAEMLGAWVNFPHSKILHGRTYKNEERIVNAIIDHVREHGTLNELALHAEGGSRILFTGKTERIEIDSFLNRLISEQRQLKMQITKRVVFLACNIFTNLSPEQVGSYRQKAMELDSDIVGTTSEYIGSFGQKGRLVQFTHDGAVIKDHYDQPRSLVVKLCELQSIADGYSSSWFSCHAERTQAEGAKLQEQEFAARLSTGRSRFSKCING